MATQQQGEKLKKLVKLSDLTAGEVAKKIGVSRDTLYRFFDADELDEYYIEKLKKIGFDVEEKRGRKNSTSTTPGIPIYDLHASAGNIEMYTDNGSLPAYHVTVPGYEDCKFGMFVYGHSMYPTIENGSLVLCKLINDKSVLLYGEIYVITTGDYRMVKRIQRSPRKGHINCTSDNQEKHSIKEKKYEAFELSIDKVKELYLVKGIIKKTQS